MQFRYFSIPLVPNVYIYIYDLFIPFGTLYMIFMGEYNTVSTIWNYVTNVSSYDEPRSLKLSAGIRLALT